MTDADTNPQDQVSTPTSDNRSQRHTYYGLYHKTDFPDSLNTGFDLDRQTSDSILEFIIAATGALLLPLQLFIMFSLPLNMRGNIPDITLFEPYIQFLITYMPDFLIIDLFTNLLGSKVAGIYMTQAVITVILTIIGLVILTVLQAKGKLDGALSSILATQYVIQPTNPDNNHKNNQQQLYKLDDNTLLFVFQDTNGKWVKLTARYDKTTTEHARHPNRHSERDPLLITDIDSSRFKQDILDIHEQEHQEANIEEYEFRVNIGYTPFPTLYPDK